MEKTTRKSVAPYYAVAAVWVTWALLFPLYRAFHFISVAGISLALFFGLRIAGKKAEEAPAEPEPAPEPASSGNPELDKMMEDGRKAIAEMKRLNDSIQDETISAQIDRLEEVSRKIFDQVKAEPKKLPEIRKFMDYYLPTTLKLLNAYDRMGAAGVSGDNISGTMQRVEEMMGAIVTAFEKQLDSLFGSDALDIRAEMTVLETMMAREGLAGDQMQAETTKNADGTDIKLEL